MSEYVYADRLEIDCVEAERDRLKALNAELVETLEALVKDLLENQGIDAEAIAKHAGRAALAKTRKED